MPIVRSKLNTILRQHRIFCKNIFTNSVQFAEFCFTKILHYTVKHLEQEEVCLHVNDYEYFLGFGNIYTLLHLILIRIIVGAPLGRYPED